MPCKAIELIGVVMAHIMFRGKVLQWRSGSRKGAALQGAAGSSQPSIPTMAWESFASPEGLPDQ